MTEADHILAGGIALLALILLFRKAPPPTLSSRRDFYLSSAATGAALGCVVLLVWQAEDRPLEQFGLFDWIGDPVVTAAGGIAWILLLFLAFSLVKRGVIRQELVRIYSKLEQLMPRTRAELSSAWGVSATAGFGEEILYRGFLLWYGTMLAGLPASVIGTSLLFGIAHGYQSRFGIIFATVAGLALAGVYWASGSLMLAIWIHATYDMWSFTVGRLVLSEKSASIGSNVPPPGRQ